jgi:hypothetical protein
MGKKGGILLHCLILAAASFQWAQQFMNRAVSSIFALLFPLAALLFNTFRCHCEWTPGSASLKLTKRDSVTDENWQRERVMWHNQNLCGGKKFAERKRSFADVSSYSVSIHRLAWSESSHYVSQFTSANLITTLTIRIYFPPISSNRYKHG